MRTNNQQWLEVKPRFTFRLRRTYVIRHQAFGVAIVDMGNVGAILEATER